MREILKVILLLLWLSISKSDELEETIACVQNYIKTIKIEDDLSKILIKAFPNTLSTTVKKYNLAEGIESLYIITGDIAAMWLRDSTNQFVPYLRMTQQCPHLSNLTRGLINTQASFLMLDPYSNAFRTDGISSSFIDHSKILIMGIPFDLCNGAFHSTRTIWERKFQTDSLASFLRLIHLYYNRYHSMDFLNLAVIKGLKRIISTIKDQIKDQTQQLALGINRRYYTFERSNEELPKGRILPSNRTGMIKSGFRASDSPNQLPYNIPANAMLSSYLKLVGEILANVSLTSIFKKITQSLAKEMLSFAADIQKGVNNAGVILRRGTKIYAYEIDGYGNYRLYDDANLPSLMSMPYLGYISVQNEIYQSTRKFILSAENLYFYSKATLSGVGSSHTQPRYIWHLALITQIMTSQNNDEIAACLKTIVRGAKNDLMHESFLVDNPTKITRQWFAWANSYFGQMILFLYKKGYFNQLYYIEK